MYILGKKIEPNSLVTGSCLWIRTTGCKSLDILFLSEKKYHHLSVWHFILSPPKRSTNFFSILSQTTSIHSSFLSMFKVFSPLNYSQTVLRRKYWPSCGWLLQWDCLAGEVRMKYNKSQLHIYYTVNPSFIQHRVEPRDTKLNTCNLCNSLLTIKISKGEYKRTADLNNRDNNLHCFEWRKWNEFNIWLP